MKNLPKTRQIWTNQTLNSFGVLGPSATDTRNESFKILKPSFLMFAVAFSYSRRQPGRSHLEHDPYPLQCNYYLSSII
jgi:hypothetical protein